jgi:hypothetical protein
MQTVPIFYSFDSVFPHCYSFLRQMATSTGAVNAGTGGDKVQVAGFSLGDGYLHQLHLERGKARAALTKA